MAKDTASKARQSLARMLDETPELFEILLERGALLKAYLDSTPRTCGSPNCRCARGEKHPAWVVRIPQEKGTRSRSVSKETFDRLEPLAEEYRRFRQAQTRWRKLVAAVDDALGILERERLVPPEEAIGKATWSERRREGKRTASPWCARASSASSTTPRDPRAV